MNIISMAHDVTTILKKGKVDNHKKLSRAKLSDGVFDQPRLGIRDESIRDPCRAIVSALENTEKINRRTFIEKTSIVHSSKRTWKLHTHRHINTHTHTHTHTNKHTHTRIK